MAQLSTRRLRQWMGMGIFVFVIAFVAVLFVVNKEATAEQLAEANRQSVLVRTALVDYALAHKRLPASLDELAAASPEVAALRNSSAYGGLRYLCGPDGAWATFDHRLITYPQWKRTLVVTELIEERDTELAAERARQRAAERFDLNVDLTKAAKSIPVKADDSLLKP